MDHWQWQTDWLTDTDSRDSSGSSDSNRDSHDFDNIDIVSCDSDRDSNYNCC